MAGAATRAELLKGARFGQHEIVRLVGHGATASVFEARHATLGKRVALKVLHEHLAQSPEVTARFVREGQVAAQLQHPSIIDVLDVGVQDGVAYLVMELLEGRDLREELEARVKLSPAEALAIFLPLASALAHAHEKGALHRDLKPANVVLAKDHRGDVVPKLVDFGLSKIVGDGPDKQALTAHDTVVGTVLYMAPEQTYGSALATAKSDQYSLAFMLYEAIAGQPPFESQGFYELIETIRNQPIRPPSLLDPRLPEELDAVLLRALARDPEKRWPSVRAFGEALLPFADDATRAAWGRDFQVSQTIRVEVAASVPRMERAVPAPSSSSVTVAATASTPSQSSAMRRIEPLPCAPGTSPFHIKGMAYRGIMQFVIRGLPGGIDALCDAFDDFRMRDFVRQPFLATSYYDVFPALPLVAAIARIVGGQLAELSRMGAMQQANYDAKNVFKRMFETMTIEDLGDRLPRFGQRYYDFGKSDGWMEAPGHVVSRHSPVPAYVAPWFAPMHAGYAEATVRLLGAADAVGTERRPVPAGSVKGYPVVTVTTDVRFKR